MASPASPSHRRTSALLRAACGVALLAFLIHAVLWVPRLTHGYAMYYTYARMVLEGEDLAKAYDAHYFNEKVHTYGFDLRDQPNNAPTGALAYMAVAWLPPLPSRIVWSVLSLTALAFALKLLFTLAGISPGGSVGTGLLTLVFLWHPAWETVSFGQVYFLLLLFFVLSMSGLAKGKAPAAGMPLGGALLVKGYGLVPALLLLVRRRSKAAGICLLTVLLVAIVTIPLLGADAWPSFASSVLPTLGRLPPDAHVAYQTVNGFLRHLFTYDPVWAPHPLLVLPGGVVTGMSLLLNLAVILFVLLRARAGGDRLLLLSFAAAVAAGVVTAPLAEEYHYVLFLPLVFGLASRLEEPGYVIPWRRVLGAGCAALVMAAPFNPNALQNATFPLVLLAYPKLFAGVVLLWCYGLETGIGWTQTKKARSEKPGPASSTEPDAGRSS